MIPRNILNMALRVTGSMVVNWYASLDRTKNEIGLWVSDYADPVPITGSFQFLSAAMVALLGLDMKKDYVEFFTTTAMADLSRDISGDQFDFNGSRYQVMRNEDWHAIAGFNNSIAVKITA